MRLDFLKTEFLDFPQIQLWCNNAKVDFLNKGGGAHLFCHKEDMPLPFSNKAITSSAVE